MKTISTETRETLAAVKSFARSQYAWPGGYQLAACCTDGATLCQQCVKDNYREVLTATRDSERSGWGIDHVFIHWEGAAELCDHCGDEIESAYGEAEQ